MPSQSLPSLFSRDYVLLILMNFLLFMGFQLYPSGLPPYLKELGASDVILGLATFLIAIPAIASRLLAGYFLDAYGRFGVLFCGLILMTVVAYFLGLAGTVGMILLLRGLHGIAWGAAATGAVTAVTDLIPRSRLGEGMGIFSLSCAVAMAIAPALALSLPYTWMFRLGVWFLGAAALLSLIVRYKKIAKGPRGPRTLIERASLMPAIIVAFSNASYGAVVTFAALLGYACRLLFCLLCHRLDGKSALCW